MGRGPWFGLPGLGSPLPLSLPRPPTVESPNRALLHPAPSLPLCANIFGQKHHWESASTKLLGRMQLDYLKQILSLLNWPPLRFVQKLYLCEEYSIFCKCLAICTKSKLYVKEINSTSLGRSNSTDSLWDKFVMLAFLVSTLSRSVLVIFLS